jgi:hypothetical protein
LCGPAAFLNCVARDHPTEYVRYVLSLATTGEGALGKLMVRPGGDCRKAVVGSDILPVDWVALASLRDSSNTLWDVESPGSSAAGITTGGAMAAWFKGTGWFQGVCDKTNGVVSASPDRLLELTATDGHVCLLIRAAIVSSASPTNVGMDKIGKEGKPKTWFGTADHWIVLRDKVTIGGVALPRMKSEDMEEKSLDFRFWHWGADKSLPSVCVRYPDLTVGQFLPYYYGYVRASKK